ncbi:hypothetical protein [Chitinophaga rhizophila]|uniref:Uncharacterized protein n=1 Tax=Chitinophaga rhizophila TaxID=2866212 RepID=A0ABS7GK93_9BACT|nr:hypothetical protein [Chitinophaga rhizophila]MBW8688148.1 hypothetical protein [Chitinophaga rhizophila]
MDTSWLAQHLERIDKRIVRKIITTATKGQQLPVTIRPASSTSGPNKFAAKNKALR